MDEPPRPIVLTVAGLDPSGGAGIASDLRTFERLGVQGAAVLTLLTVQSTRGVSRVDLISASLVEAQLEEVLSDLPVRAVKTGALGGSAVVRVVARSLSCRPACALVVDPVLAPTRGVRLCDDAGLAALRTELLPLARVVTPNVAELGALSGMPVGTDAEVRDACRALVDLGARAVLAKGGHRDGPQAVDLLFEDGEIVELSGPRLVPRGHLHGAGCMLSAALAAGLGAGLTVSEAARRAKAEVFEAIFAARRIGRGDLLPLR